MDNVPETSSATETSATSSVGSVLRAAREAQGLTIADVAERIKFSVKQVEALEEGKSEVLPEGAFLRGFVRSYARTLHLDETPLLVMMSPVQVQHGDVSAVQAGGLEFMPAQGANKKSLYLMAAALLVAVVLALFIWIQKDEANVEKVVVQEVKLPEMEAASSVAAASSAVSAASAVVIAEAQLVQAIPPKVVEPAKAAVVAPKVIPPVTPAVVAKPKLVEPTSVVAKPSPVVEKPTLPLDQLKKRPIHIVFTQDSWMEVVDTNGELLLSRMNLAGTEKWIGGGRRAPYKVAIGKAAAVKVFYKGREVDLSKYNQSGVVRLVLE
ncbi:MAG: RodZ domain-containing protein [Sideroxydans sp.]|jgi:cytoskeleton protein RodZ